jgi:hypothetical protein
MPASNALCMAMAYEGNERHDHPWDFRQPAKKENNILFEGTDRVQSYQLAMRAKRRDIVGLDLSLHNIWSSDRDLNNDQKRLGCEMSEGFSMFSEIVNRHDFRML